MSPTTPTSPMSPDVRKVTTPAGDPAWLVTGYDTVKRLLADPRLGRSHPEPDRAARFSDAQILGRPEEARPDEVAEHRQLRRLLAKSFSARRLALLRPRVEAVVAELLDDLAARPQPADFHDAISFPLPALVICELLGVPYEDREDFRRWSDDVGDMSDGQRSAAGMAALHAYMRELVERRRAEPAEDVITDLVTAQVDGRPAYDSDSAAQLGAGLLFAGHETTVTAIDSGVVLLLTHPEQVAELERGPEAVSRVVEEILRFGLPNPGAEQEGAAGLPRYANADIEVGDTTIAAGDLVVLDLRDANQDTVRFPEPADFDARRTDNPHVTFGHGPRFCVGAPLARIELTALFETLFTRFPMLRLAVPPDRLRPRSHLLTGGWAELPVRW
ncbi:cytochrome P450 [Actinopolymorpha rutila]|uniref:Pentalenolactone synthase n=1 Tax=Actinopolymorpha rutila TaxID=446787 RepID=A0A852Z758_9ACTN|nr:cytochrome P450 [Actinopolymorpha rutila]NYH88045.1 pentalenolactone synthase [Actinopolymorpha rutila]